MLPGAPNAVQDMVQKATQSGVKGNRANSQAIIKGWLLDPDFNKGGFWKTVESVTSKKDLTREQDWCSKKQFYDEYGESEAEEMIENGSCLIRHRQISDTNV